MSEFSNLPIVARMMDLGFRLRINPWDEEKRVIVVGWDIPKFEGQELPPQCPPCGFYYAKNEKSSIEAVMELTARKSFWFYHTPYFVKLAKFCFWKAVYFYFPHHLTKYERSSYYTWNWLLDAKHEVECKERLKFWTRGRCPHSVCLAPIDQL